MNEEVEIKVILKNSDDVISFLNEKAKFVKEKNPTDDLQITLCIGSFLEQKEGVEFFTSKEIEEGFRKAKLKIPQNVTDKVNQCIKKGWVAENKEKRDGKKTFYITISGQEKIDGDFKKNV